MTTILVSDEKIGEGSYGEVFTTEISGDRRNFVTKVSGIDSSGIVSVIEPIIMSSIRHRNINRAESVLAERNLYITQERAISDMGKLDRGRYRFEDFIKWTHELLSALKCFHKIGIIHGDIKPSNVLLFEDGSVRICDFSLSRFKLSKEEKYIGVAYTTSYRPPECFRDEPWNESADIWALGCTLYEMFFGEELIPYLGRTKTNREQYLSRMRSLDTKLLKVGRYSKISNLISHMVVTDPNSRIDAESALRIFFPYVEPEKYSIEVIESQSMGIELFKLYYRRNKIEESSLLSEYASRLYNKCLENGFRPSPVLIESVAILSYKINRGNFKKKFKPNEIVADLEVEICERLEYKLLEH